MSDDEIGRIHDPNAEAGISGEEEFPHDEGSGAENADKTKQNEKPKVVRKKKGHRPVLNAERLVGPRGLAHMDKHFFTMRLYGRTRTVKRDYDKVLRGLEMWSHQLYPAGNFDDILKKIEHLGNNRRVKNYVNRIKLGLEDTDEDSGLASEDPLSSPPQASPDTDDNASPNTDDNASPNTDDALDAIFSSQPMRPSPPAASSSRQTLTEQQQERMLQNRKIAEERKAKRLKQLQEMNASQKTQTSDESTS
ncbi:TIMELESS-interacting protein-like [Macrosteles quadrilineatus]|uniref:TIMELESS-interacting protein-like n=1 Tax=Macrosteles quadrilineatus TaxID=74068 RepID=UPI0023E278AC|nr:TIMELESS-interacting protein-like [Macrosteles quadrilineatus]